MEWNVPAGSEGVGQPLLVRTGTLEIKDMVVGHHMLQPFLPTWI